MAVRRVWSVAAVLAGAGLCAAQPGRAEPLRLCTSNLPPLIDTAREGGGPLPRLIREGYAAEQREVEIAYRPWRRCERGVKSGRYDATFPYIKTEKRQADFAFSTALFARPFVPIVPAADAGSVRTVADLRGRTVCQADGWTLGVPELTRMVEAGEIARVRPPSYTTCLRMVARERVDFMTGQPGRVRHLAQQVLDDPDRIHLEPVALAGASYHLMFDRDAAGTEGRVADANAAVTRMHSSDLYERVFRGVTVSGRDLAAPSPAGGKASP